MSGMMCRKRRKLRIKQDRLWQNAEQQLGRMRRKGRVSKAQYITFRETAKAAGWTTGKIDREFALTGVVIVEPRRVQKKRAFTVSGLAAA